MAKWKVEYKCRKCSVKFTHTLPLNGNDTYGTTTPIAALNRLSGLELHECDSDSDRRCTIPESIPAIKQSGRMILGVADPIAIIKEE